MQLYDKLAGVDALAKQVKELRHSVERLEAQLNMKLKVCIKLQALCMLLYMYVLTNNIAGLKHHLKICNELCMRRELEPGNHHFIITAGNDVHS